MNKNSSKPRKKEVATAADAKANVNGNSTSSPVEDRFARARTRLNPRRQRVLRAILDSAEETCFLSSRELAKRYNVDATTILRTTQVLGYKSFADFSTDLRQHFVTRITPYAALKAATREKRSVTDHIDHALDKAVENLKKLDSDLDRQRLIELAKLIKRSRRVLVVGLDFATSLAYYFAYGLSSLGFDADAPVGSTGNLQHKLKGLTSKDLLIAISFGQCLRDTVESVLRAKRQGVPTFGITDSDTSPIARYADAHLVALVASPSFLNSYVAPMAAITAIHVACAHVDPKGSLTRLRASDREYASGARWYREPKSNNQK
ncbi:MAG TPA: MurR/RpiR family transcriptional regulator [Pyrinomonadaceae bacterium]|nr:MurR/RpiR family transcriptional regulator [Pyrinomonadaceae bacterium]